MMKLRLLMLALLLSAFVPFESKASPWLRAPVQATPEFEVALGKARAAWTKLKQMPDGLILKRWGRRAKEQWVRELAEAAVRLAPVTPPLPEPAVGSPEERLRARMTQLLATSALSEAINGVFVWDLATHRAIFAMGPDRQLNPASNMKVVSTGAALTTLGPDFRFTTQLLGPRPDDAGVVHGDVRFQGSADPTLAPPALATLAMKVAGQGVRRIRGDILVGADGVRHGLGTHGLRIAVTGAARAGGTPRVTVTPSPDYLRIVNRARTASRVRKPKAQLSLTRRPGHGKAPDSVELVVTGTLRVGQSLRYRREVPGAAVFAAETFRSALLAEGIVVDGRVRVSEHPPPSFELARVESIPLSVLVRRVNKPSWNWLADRVVRAAGVAVRGETGAPGTAGVAAMAAYLESVGVNADSVRMENGSGLSYTNHLSARQLVRVLADLGTHPAWGPEFTGSLALGGWDGTLRRRMRSLPCRGLVRAKTGTLTSVATLAGFVSLGQDTLVFAFLSNGFPARRTNAVRAGLDAMASSLFTYLEERRPVSSRPAPSAPLFDAPVETDTDSDAPEEPNQDPPLDEGPPQPASEPTGADEEAPVEADEEAPVEADEEAPVEADEEAPVEADEEAPAEPEAPESQAADET